MSVGRLEAFSDGVIAVAITLLVLNITVPEVGDGGSLAHALGVNWPEYAAYAVSFLTIGIIWINHHAMISRLREADHTILILNIVLLMSIVVLPFSTDLLARYIHGPDPADAKLAAAVYGAALLAMSIAFSAVNRQILFRRAHLMHVPVPIEQRRAIFRRAAVGVAPYVLATGFAPLSPYITLVIAGVIALFYATPLASSPQTALPSSSRG